MSSVPGIRTSTLHALLGSGGTSSGAAGCFRFLVSLLGGDGRLYHSTWWSAPMTREAIREKLGSADATIRFMSSSACSLFAFNTSRSTSYVMLQLQ